MFTSESVTEGHPDKICDQISDAVLDAIFAEDPAARVACETAVTTGLVVVMGEITTSTYVDIGALVREVVTDIGYTNSDVGFDGIGVDNDLEDLRTDNGANTANLTYVYEGAGFTFGLSYSIGLVRQSIPGVRSSSTVIQARVRVTWPVDRNAHSASRFCCHMQ